jgi:flagellar biosynthesis chaperone FliJ
VIGAMKSLVSLRDHRLNRALETLRLARMALEAINDEISRMRMELANAQAQADNVVAAAYARRVAGTTDAVQWDSDARLRASWQSQLNRAQVAIDEQAAKREVAAQKLDEARTLWQAATKASEAIQTIQEQSEKTQALLLNNIEEEQIEEDFSSAKSKDLAHA